VIRTGKKVVSQSPEIIVARVERIVHADENFEVPAKAAAGIEVQHCVAGQPSVAIGVVLIAARMDSAAHEDACANRPARINRR